MEFCCEGSPRLSTYSSSFPVLSKNSTLFCLLQNKNMSNSVMSTSLSWTIYILLYFHFGIKILYYTKNYIHMSFIYCLLFHSWFFILFNGILNSFDYGKGVVRDRRTVLSKKIVVFVVCNLYSFTVVIHWFAYLFTPFPLILCTNCLDTWERRRVRHCGRRPSVVKGYYNYYYYYYYYFIIIIIYWRLIAPSTTQGYLRPFSH